MSKKELLKNLKSLKVVFVFLGLLLCLTRYSIAQTKNIAGEYDFTPPSPTAAELGRYGMENINMSTGAMSTTIPLYSINTPNLKLPINLTYSSNGIKVDQISSNVGMGWSLNASGVITCTVRGKQDDDSGSFSIPYPDDVNSLNYDFVRFLDAAAYSYSFDTERDLYAFNFMGQMGSFVFSRNNKAVFSNASTLQVSRIGNNFLITDADGVNYFFELSENTTSYYSGINCNRNDESYTTAWFLTKIIHPLGDTINFDYKSYMYDFSSSVSQSITKRNDYNSTECSEIPSSLCKKRCTTQTYQLNKIRTNGFGDIQFFTANNRSDIPGDYKVDSILFIPDSSVALNKWVFNYVFSNNNNYGNPLIIGSDIQHRMFLQSVSQKATNEPNEKKYKFEYEDIDGLPKRLSFSQDHWGYFNGKSNSELVSKDQQLLPVIGPHGRPLFEGIGGDREPDPTYANKGLLSKITYPTGGNAIISYEGNTYYGLPKVYSKTSHSKFVINNDYDGTTIDSIMVYSGKVQYVNVDFNVTSPNGTGSPGSDKGEFSIYEIETGNYKVNSLRLSPESSLNNYYQFGEGKTYRIIIKSTGDHVKSTISLSLYDSPTDTPQNYYTGGLRVSKITSNALNNLIPEVESYLYSSFEDLNKSSGSVAIFEPRYTQGLQIHVPSGGFCGYVNCAYTSLLSNSQMNLGLYSGNSMMYEFVVKTNSASFENGYEEHKFLVNNDMPAKVVYGELIVQAPYTNFACGNGLELSVNKFRKTTQGYKLVHKIDNQYIKDERLNEAVPSMVVRKKWEKICSQRTIQYCDEATIIKRKDYWSCTANHTHQWVAAGWITNKILNFSGLHSAGYDAGADDFVCYAPGNNWMIDYTYYHPCYGKNIGDTVMVTSELSNIDAVEYKNIVNWYYLKSVKETWLTSQDSLIETIKEFEYNNPKHLQVTLEKTKSSDGNVLTSKYWYPNDFHSSGFINDLVNNHIIGKPIIMETFNGSKITGGKSFVYNSNGSLSEVWNYESPLLNDSLSHNPLITIPSNYVKKIWFSYDSNLFKNQEVFNDAGEVSTLIWGYGKRYLIAKITNKTFQQVQTALGGIVELKNLENSLDNLFILTKINNLRNLLPDALIVSYNYLLGIGLTSQTDSKGMSIYYDYDSFGRVKTLKNQDGNITQVFDYHFK